MSKEIPLFKFDPVPREGGIQVVGDPDGHLVRLEHLQLLVPEKVKGQVRTREHEFHVPVIHDVERHVHPVPAFTLHPFLSQRPAG